MSFGHPGTDMAQRLGRGLLALDRCVAVAESCTGGGLGWLITEVPGSSGWFERGFVTYSDAAKREMLAVPLETLDTHGAVSEPTAAAMAAGALAHSHADLAAAVTGIAGPGGGTADKPVGTVCFAWAWRDGRTRTARTVFSGDRAAVREQAVLTALQGLLELVEGAR